MENPRVLFVGHTAELSGGEIALLRLTKALKNRHHLSPQVLLFKEGPLVQSLREAGIPTYVASLDPSIITLEKDKTDLKYIFKSNILAKTFMEIIRLARFIRAQNPTLVHTNSLKADLLAEAAARPVKTPVIWHIHDRISPDYLPISMAALFRAMARHIPHVVIANSKATLETLHLPPRKPWAVLHSCMDSS